MTLESTIVAAQEYLDPEQVHCVVYHHPCNDGSGAALSAWLALGDDAQYEKLAYHTPMDLEKLRGRNVIFLDCSLKREELDRLRTIAKKVVILDHHDSAMKDLAGVPGCFFVMGNSGAVLAWHYFHGARTKPPKLLQLIEDRDLWKWNDRAASEALHYGLVDKHPKLDFKDFATYIDNEQLLKLIEYGKSLIAVNQQWCEQMAKHAQLKQFKLPGTERKYRIFAMELETNKLISELAEYLYTQNDVDFVMLWFKIGDKYKISLRGNKSSINLGEIATALGGGGHPRAAGLTSVPSPLEWLAPSHNI